MKITEYEQLNISLEELSDQDDDEVESDQDDKLLRTIQIIQRGAEDNISASAASSNYGIQNIPSARKDFGNNTMNCDYKYSSGTITPDSSSVLSFQLQLPPQAADETTTIE